MVLPQVLANIKLSELIQNILQTETNQDAKIWSSAKYF